MPGRSQTANRGKQELSKERVSSDKSSGDPVKICIWPAWRDGDSDQTSSSSSTGKGKDKGKTSAASSTVVDDSERLLPPACLLTTGEVFWIKPGSVVVKSALGNEEPVVVKNPKCSSIDLFSNNTHLFQSKLMCCILSELSALWTVRDSFQITSKNASEDESALGWQPWAHIFPQPKGSMCPAYNPLGKYTVRLYWMGCWRKITVDDLLPFIVKSEDVSDSVDDQDSYIPLYPRTGHPCELWPALLTKALLEIAALDGKSGGIRELGDFSVIHLLTGWVPRVVPLDHNSKEMVWNETIKETLPLWRRDSEETETPETRRTIVLADFDSEQNLLSHKTSASDVTLIEKTLRKTGLQVSSSSNLTSPMSCPMLLMQARDEPLVSAATEPFLPVLQAPHYLGLKHRQLIPGEPLPEPPWFIKIMPSLMPKECSTDEQELSSDKSLSKVACDDKAVWMGYSDFTKTFKNLFIFENPVKFEYRNTCMDLSQTVEETSPAPPPPKKIASSAQLLSSSKVLMPVTTKNLDILFVDSATPIQLYIVFTSLSNWREGQRDTHALPLPTTHLSSLKLSLADTNDSNVPAKTHIIAGCLTIEPTVWSSIEKHPPIFMVKTTGVKGVTLSLAPGRHVLKLNVKTPIGYHVEIFSHCNFILADNNSVYSYLSKVSSLYMSYCSEFVESLLSISKVFGEEESVFESSLQSLVERFTALRLNSHSTQLLLGCVLEAWSTHYNEYSITNSMQFAWKTFLCMLFSALEQMLPHSNTRVDIRAVRSSLSLNKVEETAEEIKPCESTAEELQAASIIVRTLQRHIQTKRRQSLIQGTTSNQQAIQDIASSLPLLQPHTDTLGVDIFDGLFKLEPSLKELFPFFDDESSRAFSKEYSGTFPFLHPNSWAVVFREVFHIPVAQTLLPQFSCPVTTYILRVTDNDTMTELPQIFGSTLPLTYTPNTHGYTLQAEAWSPSKEIDGGRWSLRLVSSSEQLPVIAGEKTEFVTPHTQELVDYCLPNRDNVLFRYCVKPTENQPIPISVQLSPSKQDAYLKLQILDNEVPVSEVEARRCCIIPLFNIMSNDIEEGNEEHHKYIIQAVVVRDSWSLADSAWPYIAAIKNEENNSKPGSAKRGRGTASKKASTPNSSRVYMNQLVDMRKPHWVLRISTNASDKGHMTVVKDTEEADILRSEVQAWELEQPGRSKEAHESRQTFLAARVIGDNSVDIGDKLTESVSHLPSPPTGPVQIWQMDLTPFIVQEGSRHLLDEAEQKLRLAERQKVFKDYRATRQSVLQQREFDREERNKTKVKQVELAEAWQSELDQLRVSMNNDRDVIRETYLKEKAEIETQAAAQEEPPPPEPKAGKGKKGKKK